MTPEIEAALDAALVPLRAEGLSSEDAAKRLPKHLVGPFWARQVKRYLSEQFAKLETDSEWRDLKRQVEAVLKPAGEIDGD